MHLKGKKVTIIGLMRSGQASARLVLRAEGILRISEQASRDDVDSVFAQWLKTQDIECEFDGHTKEFICASDIIVISPGVRADAEVLTWAKEKGILVLSEIEFAFQFCHRPVIAITGSNGKTTVTTLLAKVLEASGKKACLCGNVGYPFSDYVLVDNEIDFYVLEVSSFQLEALLDESTQEIQLFKPCVSVLINVSQNHLDRHKDMDEYFNAKCKIFKNQDEGDIAILNQEDDYCQKVSQMIKSRVHFFNPSEQQSQGESWNANFIAVAQVAQELGIAREICNNVFCDFNGVEHRCELVRDYRGVCYINDSKSTTALATIWALSQFQSPVLLLCGGKDKNIDYAVTLPQIKAKVKKMFVYGQAMEKITNIFKSHIDVQQCQSLQDAVEKAKEQAVAGESVLLSPMCASYDSFKNFEERGKLYKALIFQWKD